MLTIYQKKDNRIESRQLDFQEPLPSDIIWIDIQCPKEEEIVDIQKQLGVEIPSKSEVWKNHILNRLYMENGVAYMTAALIAKTGIPYPITSAVTFILTPNYLLTIRDISPTSFTNFSQRLQKSNENFSTAAHLLEGLLEEIITRVGYNSEVVVDTLDQLSHSIFADSALQGKSKNTSQFMKDVLKKLGGCADLNSKINESMQSISRMLSFFKQNVPKDAALDNNINCLITDTNVLTMQSGFLSDKITFQLDATLGMINVEQNLIIKIFSVVAVFFLPPTLVASMYGMNFKHMPELSWSFGYPLAITIMILCALLPYFYFQKKGWL